MPSVDNYIQRIEQLHTPPQVATQLLQLTKDVDFDIEDVTKCLESDPALTVKLLKLVNSSQFGLVRQVASVRQAVTLVGQRSLRFLAMSFCVTESLAKGLGGRMYQEFWQRALTMAAGASRLARVKRAADPNEAFIAGLLADAGVLVFAQVEKEKYAKLYHEKGQGLPLLLREEEEFGCQHTELGAALLQQSAFPDPLIEAARRHHDLPIEASRLVTCVIGANLLADALWNPELYGVHHARGFLEMHFDIDIDGFIDLAVECKEDVAQGAEVFQIRMQEEMDCDAIMEQARELQTTAALESALELDSLESVLKAPVLS